jgi:molybdenum cofactor synthesis domain-containing protein
VLEARQLVDQGQEQLSHDVSQALNSMGYPDAAEHVYGMTYDDWKKRHQKKSTDAQMEAFTASMPLQAKHDKRLIATRTEAIKENAVTPSNVCCQDPSPVSSTNKSRTIGSFQPPPLPSNLPSVVRVGVLTISDRAFRQEYATGDLSGPAVVQAVQNILPVTTTTSVIIVPDDSEAIQSQLRVWSKEKMHLILTTGGTGFSPRDVTPEATRSVLDQECAGLMAFCTTECSRFQPLSSLSRGTAGILGKTLIVNLPGNPKGVAEIVPILLPILLHGLVDLLDPVEGVA